MELRKATIDDALLILSWRNDETTRLNSFQQDIILEEPHIEWMKRKLSDENCLMFMLTDDGDRVGHIRLDIEKDTGEISYMISPQFRGRGYGKAILKLVEKERPDSVRALVGSVKAENIASQRCFEALGYEKSLENGVVWYTKKF